MGVLGRPFNVTQTSYSAALTSNLRLEASFGGTFFGVGNFEREPNPTRDLVRVAEQCANGCPANGNIPGLVYRSQDFSVAHAGSYLWRASLSRVSAAHSLRIGFQHTLMTDDRTWMTNNQNLTYRVNNGVPNQLTQSISPWVNDARVGWDAVFAQDRWTRGRVTLQGARSVRLGAELVSAAAGRAVALSAGSHRHPRDSGRRQLQGHHAEDGSRD